jgi:hypothetical protein
MRSGSICTASRAEISTHWLVVSHCPARNIWARTTHKTSSFLLLRTLVLISAGTRDLPQFLQANAVTVLRLSHDRFLPNSFQFISTLIIQSYIVSILKASLNRIRKEKLAMSCTDKNTPFYLENEVFYMRLKRFGNCSVEWEISGWLWIY